ncbi:MarR family transcriptional regulator [Thomasclavelia cocleata]|uniref:DNA-binding transcriptional regulator, MarR family n=1 Tax=Thomasclavelia cocleata TaxID=69824 RepID=A0A1I0EFQ5_9FIRM|nr:MarR family transcriptional regulator [Thomasclavelia cocleata]MCR1959357.1 MarR family transcriptional regulator [Thomasclavelia cocleata]NDO42384.1 MarR family transcriptional regulator [Thomasclavelia cocleata]PJN81026.1 MarR family transcriptional regulator [Thomasclavelia cocleata]SET44037.1 DNA-binding transcriptional regulator, MarR family [Thomasclavelia cocleata]
MERMGKIINRLATLNRNDSNQRLKEYNLTGNEGAILMILKKNSEIYQEDIIKELQVDKSAVTRLLQNMVSKNLVKRIQSPDDKRYYLIAITKQGLEKQKLVDNVFSKKDRDIVAGLSKNEQIELRRMLDIIKYNLEGGKISE